MRVLVVEDEKNMNRLISEAMEDEKYSVDSCINGHDALDYTLAADYDVMILDVNLPGMDGFTVVERLRSSGCTTPVLFLTARDSVTDKVTGLDRGGDEYMTKPFQPEELLARLRALTRRKGEIVLNEATFADLTLVLDTCDLLCRERSVHLSYREFEVAKIFITNPNQTISKDQLLLKVWGTEADVADNNVEAYVSFLRKKLKYLESGVEIATLRMLGYRMQQKE